MTSIAAPSLLLISLQTISETVLHLHLAADVSG